MRWLSKIPQFYLYQCSNVAEDATDVAALKSIPILAIFYYFHVHPGEHPESLSLWVLSFREVRKRSSLPSAVALLAACAMLLSNEGLDVASFMQKFRLLRPWWELSQQSANITLSFSTAFSARREALRSRPASDQGPRLFVLLLRSKVSVFKSLCVGWIKAVNTHTLPKSKLYV